jgi:hypothetical protein
MRAYYKKIRDEVEKLKKDNRKELAYDSGMMGPGGRDQRQELGGSEKRLTTTNKDLEPADYMHPSI